MQLIKMPVNKGPGICKDISAPKGKQLFPFYISKDCPKGKFSIFDLTDKKDGPTFIKQKTGLEFTKIMFINPKDYDNWLGATLEQMNPTGEKSFKECIYELTMHSKVYYHYTSQPNKPHKPGIIPGKLKAIEYNNDTKYNDFLINNVAYLLWNR